MPPKINIKEIYIGSEIRRFKRINYAADISIEYPNKKKEKFKTIDLSQGGVCFASSSPLETDVELKVILNLLKKKKSIISNAKVSWISKDDLQPKSSPDKYKIGLEFTSIDFKDKNLLSKELSLYYE